MRPFMVHFVTEIDFVDGDEASDDMVQNYQKHLKETVQSAAQGLSLRTIKGARVESVTVPNAGQRLRCSRCGGKRVLTRAGVAYGPTSGRAGLPPRKLVGRLQPPSVCGYTYPRRWMSRGLGRIERVIAAQIARNAAYPNPMSACLSSHQLTDTVYRPTKNSGAGFGNPGTMWTWEPNRVQRKAVSGAMHRPQASALRACWRPRAQSIYLYDTAYPVSVMWARLRVNHRRFVSRSDAKKALNPDD
jgi:hypothetical protein